VSCEKKPEMLLEYVIFSIKGLQSDELSEQYVAVFIIPGSSSNGKPYEWYPFIKFHPTMQVDEVRKNRTERFVGI